MTQLCNCKKKQPATRKLEVGGGFIFCCSDDECKKFFENEMNNPSKLREFTNKLNNFKTQLYVIFRSIHRKNRGR
jgi:hypothetical protein